MAWHTHRSFVFKDDGGGNDPDMLMSPSLDRTTDGVMRGGVSTVVRIEYVVLPTSTV